jgi:hypothetical protein
MVRTLSAIPFTTYEDLSLHGIDCERLIISYVGHGLVGKLPNTLATQFQSRIIPCL